jgi:hypothetical protein
MDRTQWLFLGLPPASHLCRSGPCAAARNTTMLKVFGPTRDLVFTLTSRVCVLTLNPRPQVQPRHHDVPAPDRLRADHRARVHEASSPVTGNP